MNGPVPIGVPEHVAPVANWAVARIPNPESIIGKSFCDLKRETVKLKSSIFVIETTLAKPATATPSVHRLVAGGTYFAPRR